MCALTLSQCFEHASVKQVELCFLDFKLKHVEIITAVEVSFRSLVGQNCIKACNNNKTAHKS